MPYILCYEVTQQLLFVAIDNEHTDLSFTMYVRRSRSRRWFVVSFIFSLHLFWLHVCFVEIIIKYIVIGIHCYTIHLQLRQVKNG